MKAIHVGPGLSILLTMTLGAGSAGAAVPKKAAASSPRPPSTTSPVKATPTTKPAAAKPATPTGTIKLPYDDFALALISWKQMDMITASGKNGVGTVPVGNYWLAGWEVRAKDASGRMWRAEGGPQGQPQLALQISRGSTMEFRLATPLRSTLTVDQVDDQFAFLVRFTSTIGDHCGHVFMDDGPPPVPRLKIVDADGAVVEVMDLKWGCGFLCRKSWQAPAGVKWPLKAIVEADFGPFPVVCEPVELPREAPAAPAADAQPFSAPTAKP